VVVLSYRSGERADDVLIPLYDLLEQQGVPFEVIAVANYWDDEDVTPVVARAVAATRPRMQVVARRKHGDMGWDMRSGLRAATGDYLVVIDGDGQVPVEYALEAYRQLRETGAPIVKGRRFFRGDGLSRSLLSLAYNGLFRIVFRTRGVWDVNGRPKGMTREAWQRLDLRTDDWFTDAELILKARRLGLEVREFPVRFLEEDGWTSLVGAATVWEFVRNMTRARLGLHPALREPAGVEPAQVEPEPAPERAPERVP
jgi:glycosyltransferase involved in cell wall biosynthesis